MKLQQEGQTEDQVDIRKPWWIRLTNSAMTALGEFEPYGQMSPHWGSQWSTSGGSMSHSGIWHLTLADTMALNLPCWGIMRTECQMEHSLTLACLTHIILDPKTTKNDLGISRGKSANGAH